MVVNGKGMSFTEKVEVRIMVVNGESGGRLKRKQEWWP